MIVSSVIVEDSVWIFSISKLASRRTLADSSSKSLMSLFRSNDMSCSGSLRSVRWFKTEERLDWFGWCWKRSVVVFRFELDEFEWIWIWLWLATFVCFSRTVAWYSGERWWKEFSSISCLCSWHRSFVIFFLYRTHSFRSGSMEKSIEQKFFWRKRN